MNSIPSELFPFLLNPFNLKSINKFFGLDGLVHFLRSEYKWRLKYTNQLRLVKF